MSDGKERLSRLFKHYFGSVQNVNLSGDNLVEIEEMVELIEKIGEMAAVKVLNGGMEKYHPKRDPKLEAFDLLMRECER